jgi:osmotically-inducible protein OsmY
MSPYNFVPQAIFVFHNAQPDYAPTSVSDPRRNRAMKFVKLCLLAVVLLPLSPILAQTSAQPNDQAPAASAEPAQPPAPMQDAMPALPAGEPKSGPVSDEERVARKVRHALVMQSRYSIWDWMAFRVTGGTVELLGSVYSGGLKDSAANAVSQIEGVEKVLNHIHLLSPSPEDDRIRHQVADAIYSSGPLLSYSWSATPTIHIIVNGGKVWLEGEVDNPKDKDTAAQRANTVSGVLQVTNNLRIEQD